MKIIIVRHGEPDYEHDSLTDKGFREAELLSKRLEKIKITDIYSSPLGRALRTAKATADKTGRDIIIKDWLREFNGKIDFADSDGNIPWNLKPQWWCDKKEFYNTDTWLDNDVMCSGDVPEKYKCVVNSFDQLLEYYGYKRNGIIYNCNENRDDTIVLFCHFGLRMLLVSHLTGISPVLLWQTMFMPASSMTTFVTEEREKGQVVFKCMQLGDTSHLYGGDEEVSKSGLYPEFFGGEGCGALV